MLSLSGMVVRSLNNTPLPVVVDCLAKSFEGYFVQVPADVGYWQNRYKNARVDYNLSYGMFDDDKLVGFVINCIDYLGTKKTAYNTGTGVLPEYRGQKVVDRIYEYSLPVLKQNDIDQCLLEVIQNNDRAIAVYKRIGFEIARDLPSFRGTLNLPAANTVQVKQISLKEALPLLVYSTGRYAWDFNMHAVKAANGDWAFYRVDEGNNYIGYFILSPVGNTIVQLELAQGTNPADWDVLLKGIQQIVPTMRIINVDMHRTALIEALTSAGLENFIDQFEMEMPV